MPEARPLSPAEVAKEREKSLKRQQARAEEERAASAATARRYFADEAEHLNVKPPLTSEGTPLTLARMTTAGKPKKKKGQSNAD